MEIKVHRRFFAGREIFRLKSCVCLLFLTYTHADFPSRYTGNHVEDYRGVAATGKWYQQVQSMRGPNAITGETALAARHPLRFEVHLSHETQPCLTSKRALQ